MSEPIEHEYFNWLYAQVCDPNTKSPSRSFTRLLGFLHRYEFIWLVSGDDNRAEDGKDLRWEFTRKTNYPQDEDWMLDGCSVLEMLIAFSRRAEFDTRYSARDWFWMMLENIDISELHDGGADPRTRADRAIEKVVWRTYYPNGDGGLFPLRHTRTDQRKVEIWVQFNEYIYENDIT